MGRLIPLGASAAIPLSAALLASAALSAALSGCGGHAPVQAIVASAASILPPLDGHTSLLVVSPHPDDETLCCAGLMQRVLHAGGQVRVVWLTSGDDEWLELLLSEKTLLPDAAMARKLGRIRMQEARAAVTVLGVPPSGQLFLGYPDGGLLALLQAHRTTPYLSRATEAQAVPYSDALFPGHAYTGENLERDFATVLERVNPTLILAPSPLDQHSDHHAAGLLTIAQAARNGGRWMVRYWIVHGGKGWPAPPGLLPGIPLTAPPSGKGLVPAAFDLEPGEEDYKLLGLRSYVTQMRLTAPFLLSFVRTTELYFATPE